MIGQTRMVISAAATALPKLRQPHTDDMRAMVDDILVRCPPQRVPACFEINGQLVMHPLMADRLHRELEARTKVTPIRFKRPWFNEPFKPNPIFGGSLL